MIVHLAFTGCLLGLTVFNYYAGRRNVLYPAFLFALIWLVVFCLYMVPLIEIDNLGVYTLAVVVSGAAAFSAGAAIVGRRRQSGPVAVSRCRNSISKKVIFFCCIGVLPAFFLELRKLSGEGGFDSLLSSARVAIVDAVTNGEAPYGPIYTIAVTLATFSAFIFLIEACEWRRERVWVCASILVALAFSLLTTGRTRFLMLVVGLLGISLLKSRQFSAREAWKFARWPLLGLLVLLSVLVPIDKDISGLKGGTTEVLATYIFGYAVTPLAGFDHVLHHTSEYEHDPNHTFRDVLPSLARFLGFRYTPPPSFDDPVFIPLSTNVYTVFKFYYVDFGLTGMLVAMFLIGAGQTWLFRKALTGDHFYIFLFAISLFPLVMIAFDDMYTSFLGYLKHLAFALLYFRVLRTIPLGAWADSHQTPKRDVRISRRFTGERAV
jgi:oligosaccharide repeat unit polymerase